MLFVRYGCLPAALCVSLIAIPNSVKSQGLAAGNTATQLPLRNPDKHSKQNIKKPKPVFQSLGKSPLGQRPLGLPANATPYERLSRLEQMQAFENGSDVYRDHMKLDRGSKWIEGGVDPSTLPMAKELERLQQKRRAAAPIEEPKNVH